MNPTQFLFSLYASFLNMHHKLLLLITNYIIHKQSFRLHGSQNKKNSNRIWIVYNDYNESLSMTLYGLVWKKIVLFSIFLQYSTSAIQFVAFFFCNLPIKFSPVGILMRCLFQIANVSRHSESVAKATKFIYLDF